MKLLLKKLLLPTFVLLLCVTVDASDSFYGYQYQYDLKANRDHHKIIHGYYPYYFSEEARSKYSYSPEDKGHYKYGRKDKIWPFVKNPYSLKIVNIPHRDGVLKALPSPQRIAKLEKNIRQSMALAKQKKVVSKINEMRDINKVIAQHKWTFESRTMENAVRSGSNEVFADPTDYKRMFESK